MRKVGRGIGAAAAVLAIAGALLVIGGIGPFGRTAGPNTEPVAAQAAGAEVSPLLPVSGGPSGGSLDATIASLQQHLRAMPTDAGALADLGVAYVTQARVTADPSWYPKAQGVLDEAMQIGGGNDVDALLGEGTLALARHDFAGAFVLGRRAARVNPYDADVYGVIGDAQLELGEYDRAFATFQTMVDTKPELASYARASYARELQGDVPGAIAAMRMAFDAAGSPSDAAWAAYQLGELAWGRGDVADAKAWYTRGLGLDSTYVPNDAGLAKVAWARGDTDLALERYRDVVARYPSVEFVTALGDLYASLGRRELAAQQYAVVEATRKLQQANGVNVDLEIALFDADHGDPATAVAAARAEWARRHSIQVADAYAWALHAAGRDAAAAQMSERALALGTRNATFLFHAGMIQRSLGHDGAARSFLHDALALNPNFSIRYASTARHALDALEASA